jgi:hypothetical protein
MTEGRAFILIGLGTVLLTGIAILSLWAVGVRNVGISLGMIVPMVLGGFAIGWVGVHYDRARQHR